MRRRDAVLNKVIAISHDRQDAGDRCTLWLEQAGYEVVTRCPVAGDDIPSLVGDVAGTVVFGGKYDVDMKHELTFLRDELHFIEDVLKRDLPFLGICLGGQLLAHVLGEDVGPHLDGYAEYGYYDLEPTADGEAVFGTGLKVLQSHWHGWYQTPKGATRLASTAAFPEQAFRYGAHAYGLQFHPEATRPMLERWIGRRPQERYRLKGTHLPDRQLTDNLSYDEDLGQWFGGFLSGWIGQPNAIREAAE